MRSLLSLPIIALLAAAHAGADVYVSGFNSGGVYRFDETTGAPVGSGVFIAPGSGGLSLPHGLLRLADGSFLVASAGTDEVLRYSITGAFISKFIANGVNGVPADALDYPVDLTPGAPGELLVSSQLNDRVLRFELTSGAYLGAMIPTGGVDGPSGMVYDPTSGAVMVAGRFGGHVRRFEAGGALSAGFAPLAFSQPFGAALAPGGGRLAVAEGNTNVVRLLDAATGLTLSTLSGGLSLPVGVRFGPTDDIFVASFNGDRIARFAGDSGFAEPDLITAAAAAAAGLDGPNFFAFIPDPGGLEMWRLEHFGTIANAGPAADTADPDHDGLQNLMEHAIGSDPQLPGPSPFEHSLQENRLTLRVVRSSTAEVAWSAEASDDFMDWSTEGLSVLTDSPTAFEVSDALPVGQRPRRFLRFVVSPR